jgi:hypothetical protein
MIIYNKTWLANLQIQLRLQKDLDKGLITPAEFKAIAPQYPVEFYTPNLFVRVGLFILTCIIVLFANGLLTLMALASSGLIESGIWFFFLGVLSYIALELMAGVKNHYQSGVDDALLIISGGLFTTGFAVMGHDYESVFFTLSAVIFLINLYLSLRFADMLAATVCCIAFFAFVFLGWTRLISSGLTTLPFIMMLASAGAYWLAYGNRNRFINYQNCLVITQVVSLVAFYAAGNYYLIQTLGSRMIEKAAPVPFGTFFWAWTILLPFIYIGIGIRKKDVILLRTGLLLITATVLTFRTYYHLLSIDKTLTIAGAAVLGIAYAIIRYLKTPKHGFTYAEPDEAHLMDKLNVESLIIAETFSHTPAPPADKGVKFGGGDFGGGGSSGNF